MSAVLIHRDLLHLAVRADIVIRSDLVEHLPTLLDLAAAGHRTTATWRILESTGAISRQEREMLSSMAAGCSDQQIGAFVGLSRRQAQRHMLNLYQLLGVTNRAEATLFAARLSADAPAGSS